MIKQVITSLNTKVDEDDYLRILDTKCAKYDISSREKEIMLLLFKGSQYKEIADKLFISDNTVKTHIRNIYKKCNVHNKVELINLFKVS